jgi:hypothetical protein
MSLSVSHPCAAMSKPQLRRAIQLRERVLEACRLVESRQKVRGVHIVTRRTPESDELRQYQEYAAEHHVNLSLNNHGMISIRPQALEDA